MYSLLHYSGLFFPLTCSSCLLLLPSSKPLSAPGLRAVIKWPNDVLIRDRKVCGILIETGHDQHGRLVAVLGIGVNVNGQLPSSSATYPSSIAEVETAVEPVQRAVSSLSATATTLEMECGHAVSRE